MLVIFPTEDLISPSMGRSPTTAGDIKVRPQEFEKAAFIEAARRRRQTLNQWMIAAAVEEARRQGVAVEEPKRKAR
jgi:uncharacterized protein (DUF1778 family)